MLIRLLPEIGCGSIVAAGAIECFHSSCISACITKSELCGRCMAIWPSASALLSSLFLGEVFGALVGSSWSLLMILRTRNSLDTPRLRLPIIARGPRYVNWSA